MFVVLFISQLLVCSRGGRNEDSEQILIDTASAEAAEVVGEQVVSSSTSSSEVKTPSMHGMPNVSVETYVGTSSELLREANIRLHRNDFPRIGSAGLSNTWVRVVSPIIAGYLFVLILRMVDALIECNSWLRSCASSLHKFHADAKIAATILRERKIRAVGRAKNNSMKNRKMSSSVSQPSHPRGEDIIQTQSGTAKLDVFTKRYMEDEITAVLKKLGWVSAWSPSASESGQAEVSGDDIEVVIVADSKVDGEIERSEGGESNYSRRRLVSQARH